jgi:hypothetical protein
MEKLYAKLSQLEKNTGSNRNQGKTKSKNKKLS